MRALSRHALIAPSHSGSSAPSRLRRLGCSIAITSLLTAITVVPVSTATASPAAAAPVAAHARVHVPAAAVGSATSRVTSSRAKAGRVKASRAASRAKASRIKASRVKASRVKAARAASRNANRFRANRIKANRVKASRGAGRKALRSSLRGGGGVRINSSQWNGIVGEAASHAGKPYVWGATGPDAFDCSGYVQYVFGQNGISLPRTARDQASAARSVPRGSEQPGDLIIFGSGGAVSHIGIYAGGDMMWVARRAGTSVTQQRIYTDNYSVGRP